MMISHYFFLFCTQLYSFLQNTFSYSLNGNIYRFTFSNIEFTQLQMNILFYDKNLHDFL